MEPYLSPSLWISIDAMNDWIRAYHRAADFTVNVTILYNLHMTDDVIKALKSHADPNKAAFFPRFFKTGKGEYGEGDVFIGITVPQIRTVAKEYRDVSLNHVIDLLKNPVHECRLCALLILVDQYKRGDEKQKKKIFDLYLKNVKYINNWDLVDCSADKIVGATLYDSGETSLFDELAASKNLWKQRIAIISTFYFIRKNDFKPTLHIAEKLLAHDHDLIHKAVGWMLREVGKREEAEIVAFLKKHYKKIPRTALRYAIERFDQKRRTAFLKGQI